MQEYYATKPAGDPIALQAILSEGVFTHDFCTFLIRMNAIDATILLIQKIQDKPVEEKLHIIEESFNRQYAICLSAVKDHSFHMKSVQQSMILVESEEPEEVDMSTPSSAPSDEYVKTMLPSNKLMQKNIDQIQNQIKNRDKSKDRKVDDKPTGYPP